MLCDRFDAAREAAAASSEKARNTDLAQRIKAFQFRDINPKAAIEITSLPYASKLLGRTNKQIKQEVYQGWRGGSANEINEIKQGLRNCVPQPVK